MELQRAESNLKPFIECPCGCTMFGHPRARAWKDGLGPHVRKCPCKRCQAPRFKKNASRRERKIGKAVGGARNPGSGAWGGADTVGGVALVEETANVGVTRGIRRWWESKTVTNKVSRLYEHALQPRALVLSWDARDPQLLEADAPGRVQPQIVVMTYADWVQLCALAQDAAA